MPMLRNGRTTRCLSLLVAGSALMVALAAPALAAPYVSCTDGHIAPTLDQCPPVVRHHHDDPKPYGGGGSGLLGGLLGGFL
jgi:hypothetical protein